MEDNHESSRDEVASTQKPMPRLVLSSHWDHLPLGGDQLLTLKAPGKPLKNPIQVPLLDVVSRGLGPQHGDKKWWGL